jgi:transcriptional regulator GlxA family with amidase domain
MLIAIPLFDRFTALDAVGPFQVLVQLRDAKTVFVAEGPGDVTDHTGALTLRADATLADVPQPDIIVVPGGPGQADHMGDSPLRDWLIAADQTSAWTTSVCTGSLNLADAGLLNGRRATTNWLAMDELARLGATPVQERYVFDGKYATAAGVSAGIDLALALADRIGGAEMAQRCQLGIEYDPQPPYNAGSPATAPAEIVADLRARSRFGPRVAP